MIKFNKIQTQVYISLFIIIIPIMLITGYFYIYESKREKQINLLVENYSSNLEAIYTIMNHIYHSRIMLNKALHTHDSIPQIINLQNQFEGHYLKARVLFNALSFGPQSQKFKQLHDGIFYNIWQKSDYHNKLSAIYLPNINGRDTEIENIKKTLATINRTSDNLFKSLLKKTQGTSNKINASIDENNLYINQLENQFINCFQMIKKNISMQYKTQYNRVVNFKSHFSYKIILIFIVYASTAFFFIHYAKKNISTPIRNLVKHLETQQQGEYSTVSTSANNEIRILAQEMDLAFSRINVLKKNLELQVRERTLELEKAYFKLNELNIQNSMILQSVKIGVCRINHEGNINFMNQAGLKIIGYQEKEVIDTNLHKLLHLTKKDGTLCNKNECIIHQSAFDGKVHYNEDDIFWHKAGYYIPISYTTSPIVDEAKNILGAVFIFQNAAKELQKRKTTANKAAFYKANPNPVLRVTTDFKIIDMNKACETEFNLALNVDISTLIPAIKTIDLDNFIHTQDKITKKVIINDKPFAMALSKSEHNINIYLTDLDQYL